MNTLMVIGGSGFFGKSILDSYKKGQLSRWHITSIYIVSRTADQLKKTNPELISESVILINADISNCEILPKADFIIHAAASSDASKYLSKPHNERENIQAGTINYCRLAKIFHKKSKIIYCSSGAVYGQQPASITNISEDFNFREIEEMPQIKRDYAAAKRDAEITIQKLGMSGLSVCIARCFAFVGAYLPRQQHFAVGNFIEDGLRGRQIVVHANHLVYRSYMYSDDLVSWLMTILNGANPECPIYNVGSDIPVDIGGLAKIIALYFRVPYSSPDFSNQIIDRYVPSINKARKELGLEIQYSLDASIRLTINEIQKRI